MSEQVFLEWRGFVVDERAACMWGYDLAEQNDEFLRSISPEFFKQAVEAQLPLLDGAERQNAALSIRTSYAHALETFFSLLAAAVQAPQCPLGWILRYQPGDLRRVIQKIDEQAPLLARLQFDGGWAGLSQRVHLFTHDDKDEDRRIKDLFADVWGRLAADFLDGRGSLEYNSIKHGFRSKAQGTSLRIGRTDQPDSPPIFESSSEFGSRFFTIEPLHDDKVNFYVKTAGRTWSPTALAVRVELLCVSIGNVISFLRVHAGGAPDAVSFHWPEAESPIELAWASAGQIRHYSSGDRLEIDRADLVTREHILGLYRAGADL